MIKNVNISFPPLFTYVACPKWTFGAGCSQECQCDQKNTKECHRRYGTCICKPGYQGDTCKEGKMSVKQNYYYYFQHNLSTCANLASHEQMLDFCF